MSVFSPPVDGVVDECDPWAGGEPDDAHQAELEREFEAERLDDYEVTQRHSGRGILVMATRENRQVGWISAKNPAKNEQ